AAPTACPRGARPSGSSLCSLCSSAASRTRPRSSSRPRPWSALGSSSAVAPSSRATRCRVISGCDARTSCRCAVATRSTRPCFAQKRRGSLERPEPVSAECELPVDDRNRRNGIVPDQGDLVARHCRLGIWYESVAATTRRGSLAVAIAAVGLCGGTPARSEHPLVVTSASLEAKRASDGHATGLYTTEVEFTEPHLDALRDDEAMVEIRVVDRDGHGGRRLLEDLEDCRFSPDGSMNCPRGLVFQRVSEQPPRWRLAIAFRGRSPADRFRGPVTVRITYSVSGGEETVHVGTIAACAPARGGPTLTCHADRKGKRR